MLAGSPSDTVLEQGREADLKSLCQNILSRHGATLLDARRRPMWTSLRSPVASSLVCDSLLDAGRATGLSPADPQSFVNDEDTSVEEEGLDAIGKNSSGSVVSGSFATAETASPWRLR